MLFLGLAFAVWARRHIGSNWSGTVTVKENHALVRTGPYRWVRHPIYTGLLTAILGTAICRGELRGVWGLALCTLAFVDQAAHEERWMREAFGEEYDRYRAEVPASRPVLAAGKSALRIPFNAGRVTRIRRHARVSSSGKT